MSADFYQERMLSLAADDEERMAEPDASVTLDNPLCGDRVTIDVARDGQGRITQLTHDVRGCVLCRAAAAVLRAAAAGLDHEALADVRARLHEHLRTGAPPPDEPPWEDLAVFAPVAPHKSRHECVLLPFDAALRALTQGAGDA